jgi:protein-tyrosine phosphatase
MSIENQHLTPDSVTKPSRMDVPIRNSYWVIEGQLLAGEYPAGGTDEERREKLNALIGAGIRSFVDLTEAHELRWYHELLQQIAREHGADVQYRRMSIPNRGIPGVEHMEAILRHIRNEIDAGRPVYVHCWGGIGRTGTLVGCWLIDAGTCAAVDAIARIADLRYRTPDWSVTSPETPVQVEFVRAWISVKTNRQV